MLKNDRIKNTTKEGILTSGSHKRLMLISFFFFNSNRLLDTYISVTYSKYVGT